MESVEAQFPVLGGGSRINEEPALSGVNLDEELEHDPLNDSHASYESWSSGLLHDESTHHEMEMDALELYPEQLCSVVSEEAHLLDINDELTIKVEPPDHVASDGEEDPLSDSSPETSRTQEQTPSYRVLDNRELVLQLEPMCPELVKQHMAKVRSNKPKRPAMLRRRNLKKVVIKVEPESDSDENPYDLDTIHAKSLGKSSRNSYCRKRNQPVKVRVKVTKPLISTKPIRRKKANQNVDSEMPDERDKLDTQSEDGENEPKRKRGRRKKVLPLNEELEENSSCATATTNTKRRRRQIQSYAMEDETGGDEKPLLKRRCRQKQSLAKDTEAVDDDDDDEYQPKKRRRRRVVKEKPNVVPPEVGPCPTCLLKFYTEEELNEHACVQYGQLENKRWQCGLCPQNSAKKDEIISHLRKHTGERPFKCKYDCGAAFKDKRNCRIHQMSRKHENDRKFCCGICNLRFTSSTLMRCHEATHGERKFFCSFEGCNRGFLTRIRLVYHERRHKGEKVICKVCKEGVFQADRSRHEKRCLRRKQREAEELKPFEDILNAIPENREGVYTCRECRLQFDSEFNLMAHPCCHYHVLAENVWRCGICSKVKKMPFSDFKEHLKVHTAERKYSCPICGKKFRYQSRQILHVNSHGGMKKFLCQTCGASYTNKPRFSQHIRRMHPEIPLESVLPPVKRSAKARQEDESLAEPEPVVVQQKKTRGPNRKSTGRQIRQIEVEQHIEVPPVISSDNHSHVPIPISIPYTINQPQLEQLQAFTNYPLVPPRQMLPDPREWNWQWQTQPQISNPYAPHPHQPYYQYHPQHTVDPTQNCEPSGPSSVASASLEGSEESVNGIYQSDNFVEEQNSVASDWQDDFEDPWESVFPSKAPSPTKSKQKRPEKATIILPQPTASGSEEQTPAVDETELITRIAQNKWKCNTCSRVSSYLFEMRSHVRIHLGIKPFACPQCDKRFKDKRNMKIHYRIHSGEYPYHCPYPQCGKKFRHNAPFNVHKRSHGDMSFLFPSAQDLPFECTICAQRYRTDEELKCHKCLHYRAIEGGFKCGTCLKIFRRRREAASHVLIHTGENPYCCDQCGKGFKNKRSMLRHQDKSHLGITKSFSCSICSKVFTTNYNKDIHERKHRQELLEICNICAMGFFDKQSYKHHIARHEAGGPTFKCSICSTELTTKYELCVHSKSHGIYPKSKPKRKRTASESQGISNPSDNPETSTEYVSEDATKPSLRPRVSASKSRGTGKSKSRESSSESESEESEGDDESEEDDSEESGSEEEARPKMRVMRVKITTIK